MTPECVVGPSASTISDRSDDRERQVGVLGAAVGVSGRKSRKRCPQGLRGLEGVLGVRDRSDDDDASSPRLNDLLHIRQIDATDREPGSASRSDRGRIVHEFDADRVTSRLRRCSPDGSHAEIVGFGVRTGSVDLVGRVSRQPKGHSGTEKRACRGKRQIVLAEVQDRASRTRRDVGAVVDGPQLAVPLGGILQNLQDAQLGRRFECFVAKLNDVDTPAECGVDEVGEVTLAGTSIRAEIQL